MREAIDPFDRARKIRSGSLDAEMPTYDELTGWLQRVPMTMLPGLLRQCVFSCVAEKCFVEGGLGVFVARAERDAKDPSHVLRHDAAREAAKGAE